MDDNNLYSILGLCNTTGRVYIIAAVRMVVVFHVEALERNQRLSNTPLANRKSFSIHTLGDTLYTVLVVLYQKSNSRDC